MQNDSPSLPSGENDRTTAVQRGRLAALLLRPQNNLWSRFLARYAHLRAMPRGIRRVVQR